MIADAVGVVPASPSAAGTGAGPVSQLGSHVPLSRDGSMVELSRENSLSDTCNTSAASRREAARRQAAAEAALLKKAVGGGKTITFAGGVAFLINNVTGGGMVLFPGVMQQAGWAVVVIALLAVMLLASVCGFMLIEAMAMMPGNKRFGKRAEYTTITKHYLPPRLYWASQFFFQASLLANGVSMIVQSVQVMDFTIAELFGSSCALPQFHPTFAFHCPPAVTGESTVFGDGVYLVPLGWFVTALVVLPLGMVNLDQSMFVQQGGFVAVVSIVLVWVGLFATHGLDASRVPPVGDNFTTVLGVVLFNFAMITSIPSWVNEKRESVSIEKSFACAMPLAGCLFVLLGLVGGMAFAPQSGGQTILVSLYTMGTKISKITFFLFPACVNLTSIPVFSIMQRYNLVSSGVCGPRVALFLAVVVPWLLAVPLYTGSGYQLLVTWSGICISSVVNFLVPPVLYLLAIRSTRVEAERRQSMRNLNAGLTDEKLDAAAAANSSDGGGATDRDSSAAPGRPRLGRLATTSRGARVSQLSQAEPKEGANPSPSALAKQSTQSWLEGEATGPTVESQSASKGSKGSTRQLAEGRGRRQTAAAAKQKEGQSEGDPLPGATAADALPPDRAPLPPPLVKRSSVLASAAEAMSIAAAAAAEALGIQSKGGRRERRRAAEKEKRARAKRARVPDETDLPQPPLLAPPSPWAVPPASKYQWERAVWAALLPFSLAMHYTIPHASSFSERATVPSAVAGLPVLSNARLVLVGAVAILAALAWSVALAFMLVWCASLFSEATSIHPLLLGLFVLGVGTRLPSLLTELRGYRSGNGDLNRVFLNSVMQILVCVPLPWIIAHALSAGAPVRLHSGSITVLCLSLFIMGSLVVIVFRSYEWMADKFVVGPLAALALFFFVESWLLDYGVLLNLTSDQCIET